ncbi:MAG: Fic/DOC family N-terminal domain-containing protein [Candidatus Omnitrophica bacterium]|nr:Fic/DOC family N-terminal domain-containing protein [Candidatus Omnitrophota bacterium]
MPKIPFIPPKLPPKIDYSFLIKEIGQAHDALGQLNGLLVNIPNPSLLTTPLLTKEAVLSSRIEGTQATLKEVFEYEAEAKSSEEDAKERDVREIINYRRAMDIAIDELAKRQIGENLLKRIHHILLYSARGAHKDRGQFRKSQVYIGPPNSTIDEATYIPPPPAEILSLLSNWEAYINLESEKDVLVQIGVAHYQFEAIHPFMDGNGRIGRLIIPLFLYQRKLLSHPLLYISEYFESRRSDYYGLLNGISGGEGWENWLKFFLQAVTVQSLKTQGAVLKILVLYRKLKDEIAQVNAVHAVSLLDIIFASPVISFVSIKKRIRARSYQTIYNLLNKFVALGILKETPGRKRNRIFIFQQLLDILK